MKLKEYLTTATAVGDVYTWGNGANYQLGSGAVGLQLMPARLEALHGLSVRAVVAAKFHTAAITEDGQLFTWGFGRGGRLGRSHHTAFCHILARHRETCSRPRSRATSSSCMAIAFLELACAAVISFTQSRIKPCKSRVLANLSLH